MTNASLIPDPATAREISRRLRVWFRRHGRDLPWRRTRDPYRVLVSELMLQQTQVSRVIDFYHRFLERFPTLLVLASAPPGRVMDSWRGLGYYARARNLHALARVVRSDHDGVIPRSVPALRALPGVGPYTAGAVASFAYEQSAALVDTNVARVLSRIFAPELRPKRSRDLTRIWRLAEEVIPARGQAAWTHNQAIMELGALVCTARVMHCDRCPVSRHCLTLQGASTQVNGATPGRRSKRTRSRRGAKSKKRTSRPINAPARRKCRGASLLPDRPLVLER